jgi:OmpA-OmpF porin, OOP family
MIRLLFIVICFCTGFTAAAQNGYRLEGNQVVIDKPILFKTGTAVLQPVSDSALQIIKKYLGDKSYISTLRIEGHIAAGADAAKNQLLSRQRALAVSKRLVQLGADCKRLIAVGFGDTKPLAVNTSPEGRAQNTRIAFYNAALRGRLIGGMPADGGGQLAGDPCQ